MKKLLNTALLLFAVLMTSCTAPNAWELVSKDSNVRFALENKQENGSTMLSYSVFYGWLWIIVSMEKTHNLFPLLL